MSNRELLGYRVRDVTERSSVVQYVVRGTGGAMGRTIYASLLKGDPLRYSDALRNLADWLDAGYKGRIVRVVRKTV